MEPVIYSPHGLFTFEPSLPNNWRGKILPGSDPWYYGGPAGTIALQKFKGDQFYFSYTSCHFFKDVNLNWKEKPVLRLQYILEGRLSYKTENKIIKLKPGQMNAVWAPERETKARFSKGKFEMFQICIRPEIVQELLPEFPETRTIPSEHLKRWFGKYEVNIYEVLDMHYGGEARSFFYKTKMREYLLAFLNPIMDDSKKYSEDVKERIYKVDRKILEDLSYHHTTGELADFARMTEAKLLDAFREIIGVSMFDRYKEAKLQKAKKYLLETNVQVKVLYEMVGYDSYSGFVEAFKDRFGLSPLQFRKKYRPFD